MRTSIAVALLLAATARAEPACDITAAAPAISKWFGAWNVAATQILHIDGGPPPLVVFYDSQCVYTTSAISGAGAQPTEGPPFMGASLKWYAKPHGGTITFPDGERSPLQLMSMTSGSPKTGPYFVMALPDYWVEKGAANAGNLIGLTAVFLHEFSHIRQAGGFKEIGDIEKTWKFKERYDDDVVQSHFKSNEEYVKAFSAERDLLYRAAAADTVAESRALAADALRMMKQRQARWFTGDEAVFATLDSVWLSLEGSGQWLGAAWLAHPKGGGMTKQAAVDRIRGGKFWSQDEGLGLFLVIDRLLPSWPSLVYRKPSIGAVELLERAVRNPVSE